MLTFLIKVYLVYLYSKTPRGCRTLLYVCIEPKHSTFINKSQSWFHRSLKYKYLPKTTHITRILTYIKIKIQNQKKNEQKNVPITLHGKVFLNYFMLHHTSLGNRCLTLPVLCSFQINIQPQQIRHTSHIKPKCL